MYGTKCIVQHHLYTYTAQNEVLLFVGETQKKNAGTDERLETGESRSETMQVP